MNPETPGPTDAILDAVYRGTRDAMAEILERADRELVEYDGLGGCGFLQAFQLAVQAGVEHVMKNAKFR